MCMYVYIYIYMNIDKKQTFFFAHRFLSHTIEWGMGGKTWSLSWKIPRPIPGWDWNLLTGFCGSDVANARLTVEHIPFKHELPITVNIASFHCYARLPEGNNREAKKWISRMRSCRVRPMWLCDVNTWWIHDNILTLISSCPSTECSVEKDSHSILIAKLTLNQMA